MTTIPRPGPAAAALPGSAAGYEHAARGALDPGVREWIDGGAGAGRCAARNRAAFAAAILRPRVLCDVSDVSTATSILGGVWPIPVAVAPMACHQAAHPGGETETAAGAGAAGVPVCVSMFASRPLEGIAAAASAPLWLQVYPLRDRGVMRDLIQRARDAGFQGIVLTAGTPVLGRPARLPARPGLRPVNLPPDDRYSDPAAHAAAVFDQAADWKLVQELTDGDLPVIVKGVMTAADAQVAAGYGAAAVIVSNHGGRQLEQAAATLDVLPEITAALAGRPPVLIDGGVRTGADVVTALARDAAAVMIGRPVLHALAAGGAAGVQRLLACIAAEMRDAMALTGVTCAASIGPPSRSPPSPAHCPSAAASPFPRDRTPLRDRVHSNLEES